MFQDQLILTSAGVAPKKKSATYFFSLGISAQVFIQVLHTASHEMAGCLAELVLISKTLEDLTDQNGTIIPYPVITFRVSPSLGHYFQPIFFSHFIQNKIIIKVNK